MRGLHYRIKYGLVHVRAYESESNGIVKRLSTGALLAVEKGVLRVVSKQVEKGCYNPLLF